MVGPVATDEELFIRVWDSLEFDSDGRTPLRAVYDLGRQHEARRAEAQIAELRGELERERVRLAVCGVVAMADTPESAAKTRDVHPDYRSASLDDVARMVDQLMACRAELAEQTAKATAETTPPLPGGIVPDGITWREREGRERFIPSQHKPLDDSPDGVMKPVISKIHVLPLEDGISLHCSVLLHCAQATCWCRPSIDPDDTRLVIHKAVTSANDGWVLVGEMES